ncbi:MAG: hypothetical protein ACR2HY_08545 [Acidimicrobiales bacterium]
MTHLLLVVSGGWTWDKWLYLVVPLGLYSAISLALFAFGRPSDPTNFVGFFFGQVADSLERATGFPGWAMAGALTGLNFLGIAVMGFYWDVAWHIDLGRDKDLFTPAHLMILTGLGGLFFAAMVTVLFASVAEVDTRLRLGWVRLPLPALLLALFGFGGVAAFPLDALWHKAYGIDVTLWSPTHLQLMAGGALATLAIWLLIAEVLPGSHPTALGRGIHALAAGASLAGLTIFQGEFDFGVPQFQVVALPVLVAAAAGFVLVLARLALGRWGAVKAVVAYLVLRGLLGFMVGGALHHTFPRFPLYLPSAMAVEAVARWVGTGRRLPFGAVAGALVGTAGLALEMTWLGAIGFRASLPAATVAEALVLGALAGVAGAVLGAGLGRGFPAADDDPVVARQGVPVMALALAGVMLLGALAWPLPRRVGHVAGTVAIERQGSGAEALVDVTLRPASAADNAIVFTVTSWQGGGTVHADLQKVAPGHYRTSTPVPITGSWKSMVTLERSDQVMAAPIYLPADPGIGAPAIPALASRDVTFVRNTTLLLREIHSGPALPAVMAYSGLAILIAVWVGLLAYSATRISAGADATPSRPRSLLGPQSPEPSRAVADLRVPAATGTSAWYVSPG